ncbi:hypothetical protein BD410DRAFT_790380 [Rickenella mellea]|uniref:F-box domain-containing protein n=1 Tax=Rickenella mellea TaxID=50990 RepID=A0A4Y7Q0Z0_9AGAM|nr:hypothetical protein BD410DRAFT_790380 [Rickenella mellea]
MPALSPLNIPQEVLLHIFSYLDLPELASLSKISPFLAVLAADPVLHRTRLQVVAPSRVEHSLFARGGSLRPDVADLLHWGVMKGLGIERRWRAGQYFYSPQSVKQYETSQRLQRQHVRHVLSSYLAETRSQTSKTASALQSLHTARVLPDVECASPAMSRLLLPVIRRLKWALRKDGIAQMVRGREPTGDWFEGKGRGIVREGDERVRLAVCPGVKKVVGFYESLINCA